MRGGFLSSFSVLGAGIETRFEVSCDARHWLPGIPARSRLHAVAGEAGLKLLVGRQAAEVDAGLAVDGDGGAAVDRVAEAVRVDDVVAGDGASNEAAVVAPVEADPGPMLDRESVLDVGGLVEFLVVIDAEGKSALPDGCAGAGDLRREEARRHRGHDDEGGDVVEVRHIGTQGEAGDLGVVPVDGEGDGRVAEDAEVEGVVGVLPDVVAADDEVLAEGLLETGVKLVAEAGLQGSGDARRAEQQRRENVTPASLAGEHEVLVEGSFERAGVGDAKNGVGLLDGVGDADAGLGLAGDGEAVVEVAAHAEIEEPVAGFDLVLGVESQLFDVGVAEEVVELPPRVRS